MDDHEIINLLRDVSPAVLDADENPPDRVIEAALAAGDWVRLDYELAALVEDSADDVATAGVRATASDLRQLTYRLADLTIQCELASGTLAGQAVPTSGLQVELIRPDGRSEPLELDVDGRFLLRPSPAGPVGFRCTRAGRRPALTPWLLA